MEISELYEIVREVKDDINKTLNEHFGFLKEKIQLLLEGKEDTDKEIYNLKDRINKIEFDIILIKKESGDTVCKISKLEDFFETFKKEMKADIEILKNLLPPKKISWSKIISIAISILSTPVIYLLVEAFLKAKGCK